MTELQRPAFFEGQILAAADLAGTVDHGRGRAARHDRYLHEWGIAEGLALTGEGQTDPDDGSRYVEVTLQPGVAVDGTGREVVVPEPVALREALFEEVNGADPDSGDAYPVFLAGLDREPAGGALVPDGCGDPGGASRVDESYQILFGRLGDERLVADQRPPAPGDGPGDGTTPWLILLGYLTWAGGRFRAVLPEAGGVRPRYAGVRADTVAARAGRLALRTAPAAAEGGPVVTLDRQAGLAFGLYRADGSVDEVLAVSPRGDVTVRGKLSIGTTGGAVAAVSGVATDGVLLPLPAGVSADEVAQGRVVLHTMLAPRPPTLDGVWLSGPVECTVDGERRVRSRMRSMRADGDREVRDHAVPVDFLVLAAAVPAPGPAASGGSGT
ncbi:hypothetical protein GCM10023170_096900 [Phytohabitans houttuyneae]|uniref:hypothetical protein n=1 Tax=Phytohabitans houttuyneae TaxID=1076126 RepID=UPI0031EC8510